MLYGPIWSSVTPQRCSQARLTAMVSPFGAKIWVLTGDCSKMMRKRTSSARPRPRVVGELVILLHETLCDYTTVRIDVAPPMVQRQHSVLPPLVPECRNAEETTK